MHTVRELCEVAFGLAGLNYADYVKTDGRYIRPSEVVALRGDASKAARKLEWRPKVTFQKLIEMMVESDLKLASEEKKLGRFISLY